MRHGSGRFCIEWPLECSSVRGPEVTNTREGGFKFQSLVLFVDVELDTLEL